MRSLIKRILHPFLKIGTNLYFSKSRNYSYEGISVTVEPGVFPPHLTISTKVFLDYLKDLDLKNETILELGCGSGIISLFSAHKGGVVTASDINKVALESVQKASQKNTLKVETLYSDLFDELSGQYFDYIIINPPYYPKQPKNVKEQAWFCGENFEYFEKLFYQILDFLKNDNTILMILSEDCDIQHIKSLATKNNLIMLCVLEKKVVQEKNFIFKIILNEKMA